MGGSWGSWCQAELVWLVSSPPGTSGGLGGAEWAKATGPGRRAASSQPLPSPHPTGGDTASPGSWAVYHHTSGNEAPRGSRIETGFPGTATISGNLGSGSSAQGHCHSVIQQTSLSTLNMSPILAWYNALLPAPVQEGNTQGC